MGRVLSYPRTLRILHVADSVVEGTTGGYYVVATSLDAHDVLDVIRTFEDSDHGRTAARNYCAEVVARNAALDDGT